MASELEPCTHCGGVAEMDYEQPFCAFPSGKMEKQVAIYCAKCDVQMSMCYSDHPEYDHDQMASILAEKWNTRPAPAATDTGLERYRPEPMSLGGMVRDPDGGYVTRSQAEELLAAERAEKDGWKELHDAAQVAVKERTEACNNLYKQVNGLKADNAAKDARIKELEQALETEKTLSRGDWACQREVDQMSIKVEDLEAKLAAAEKALEPFANAADGRKSKSVTGSVCFSQHYLLAARAARGGKPS